MTETVLDDADGAWQLRGFVGDEWQWHIGPHKPFTTAGWLPARVPGSVLDDLHRAGEVPDPYVGRNSLLSEWVPNRNWAYRRTFTLPPLEPHERAVLRFDGVDHEATVLVDDTVVVRHEGMFRPFEADITHLVRGGGEHLLAVVVHPAPQSEPQVGRTDRVRVHKARMGYGWDFCPPMVHQGVWRGVRLVVSGPARLRGVTASASLGPGTEGLREGAVRIEADLTLAEGQRAPDGTRLAVRVRDGDRVVAETERDLTGMTEDAGAHIELSVPQPRLWWPNGAGEQHLHEVEVTFTSGPHTTTRRFQVGFRRVELVPNDGAPKDALPYTLTVNGRRLYANGWNWVPLDAQYGVPRPAKLAHLLDLARAAHVNLLRVWGGGLLETEEFYTLCDQLGLMVWQEFSMSSSGMASTPASDPEFVDLMVREAHAVVPPRRHHPSLVLWCGGNELQDEKGNPLDESAPCAARPSRRDRPARPRAGLAAQLALRRGVPQPGRQHRPQPGRPARRPRTLGTPGPRGAQPPVRLRNLPAAQRVRRRGHGQPPHPRTPSPRRGGPLARRPREPALRPPRRLVEQRFAGPGLLRRTHRRRRHHAARQPASAVRRAALRPGSQPAPRLQKQRHPSLAVQRARPQRLVHGGRRPPR
ncbi:glycosyl hydrolase 2 galactose-binding domain-containing protein [Streptomyces sp. MK7]|uniref:glycoside hydrolase family 2 protein n=1 Tax=Streptomyces sp. MK7 TaxID=3067635 RepID=UPI00292D4F18|nr:sugar-binding domain-containing protein [Streptomyces sp. MK7]